MSAHLPFSDHLYMCAESLCYFPAVYRICKGSAPLSVLRDVLLIVFSLIVPMFGGVTGIFWAAPIADIIAISITGIVMVKLWKTLERKNRQNPARVKFL